MQSVPMIHPCVSSEVVIRSRRKDWQECASVGLEGGMYRVMRWRVLLEVMGRETWAA